MSINSAAARLPLTGRAPSPDFPCGRSCFQQQRSSKMSGRSNDARPRVAYQGEAGAFSEEAVLQCFPDGVDAVAHRDFRSVGEAVISGATDFGVLPVENSLAGSVLASYDVLA